MTSNLRRLALPLLLAATLSLLAPAALAQASRPGEAGLTIDAPVHDLGDFVQGTPRAPFFTLRNESSRPIVYLRVTNRGSLYKLAHEPEEPVTIAPGQMLVVPVELHSPRVHEIRERDERDRHVFRAGAYWRYESERRLRRTPLKVVGRVTPIFETRRSSVTGLRGEYLDGTIRLPMTMGVGFEPTAVETEKYRLRVLRHEVVSPKQENEPAILEIEVRTPFGPGVALRGNDTLRIRGRLPGDEEEREILHSVRFAFVSRIYATKENVGFWVPRVGTEARERFEPTQEFDLLPANEEIKFVVLATSIEDAEGNRVLDTFEIEESPVEVDGLEGTRFRIRVLVPDDADVEKWTGILQVHTNDPELREIRIPLRMNQHRGC